MQCSKFRWLTLAIVSGCCLVAISMETLAQAYPTHPVRLVVAYAPGGPTDILARTVAQKLSEILSRSVVVENRLGAGGVIATDSVAKAAPDGYTLILDGTTALSINPHFYKSIPYDARTDFTAIGPVATAAVFLFVSASVPARNFQELIALAKSKPGTLSFASAGYGAYPGHLGPELLKLKHGLDMLHIPFKGGAPAMAEVSAGRVSFLMTTGFGTTAKPFLDSGKIRALAVTGDKRAAVAPEVPTFAEVGSPLPEMGPGSEWGVLGPARLPRNIVVRLNKALAEAVAAPEVRAKLAAFNMDPMVSTPEAWDRLIKERIETWAQVLKRLNMKLE